MNTQSIRVICDSFLLGIRDILLSPHSVYKLDRKLISIKSKQQDKPRRRLRQIVQDNPSSPVDSLENDVSQITTPITKESSRGISRPLKDIFLMNVYLLTFSWVIAYVLPYFLVPLVKVLSPGESAKKSVDLVVLVSSNLLFYFWQVPYMAVMEFLSIVYIKEILTKLRSVEKSRSSSNAKSSQFASIGLLTMDRVYAFIFLLCFLIQSRLFNLVVSIAPIQYLITLVHSSLLYSFYAFEYRWCHEGLKFTSRLNRMSRYWPYLLGYGLPFGIVTVVWPEPFSIGYVLLNLFYPIIVVGAQQVAWTEVNGHYADSLPATLLLKPSLLLSELVVAILVRIIVWITRHAPSTRQ